MTHKPWRDIAIPHRDVREGKFQQSQYAADINAVYTGKATPEYQDAALFFEQTVITEGMKNLLLQVAERMAGRGGEPVIQVQTAFGGGKTHTMLAVYHMASRKVPLHDLAGVSSLLEQADLAGLPQAHGLAVIDGANVGPSEPRQYGSRTVNTLWGELAWQLGGDDAYAYVASSDVNGTSPGKEVLRTLLGAYAPCVVLMDELTTYIRQFPESQRVSGGTYDSNISFVQALTEAAKLVPNAVIVASLPESVAEAGGPRGVLTLHALEKIFGRVHSLWKPVSTEEAFEIVRRRLFEPIRDVAARDAVCRAFAELYHAEAGRVPAETQEGRYFDRLKDAYPIHPEFFVRLYEDWTTIDGFQRTRGVLKLMAKVIHRLWNTGSSDMMIMPGALPLNDGGTRNELTYYLPQGWDAVIERDVDGDRAETTELEGREPRFGQVNAARRIARTLFLATAPASVGGTALARGIDRGHAILGCLQPGQSSSIYADALSRLADRLHFLNSSGDPAEALTRFWFDTKANLRREMEDRKRRYEDRDTRGLIAETLQVATAGSTIFSAVHPFTPHADVPDNADTLRLVILPPDVLFSREEQKHASELALEYVRMRGSAPRHRGNRLMFLAADYAVVSRMRDAAKVVLAWGSIVEDIKARRLVVDNLQEEQAKRELKLAQETIPRTVRECYRWLLCPTQTTAIGGQPEIESYTIPTSGTSMFSQIDNICVDQELVITAWSPTHLREVLREYYWTGDSKAVKASTFWDDSQKYLYLPRLQRREVLAQTIRTGSGSRDFFGIAYGENDGKYDGFQFGAGNAQFDDTLLLIEPAAAVAYEAALAVPVQADAPVSEATSTGGPMSTGGTVPASTGPAPSAALPAANQTARFHASVDVPASAARMRLVLLAEELIDILSSDPNAIVRVSLEIDAEYQDGVPDHIRRSVTENVRSLGIPTAEWE